MCPEYGNFARIALSPATLTRHSDSARHNHPQGPADHSDLDRHLAGKISISVKLQLARRLDSHRLRLKVFHLLQPQVTAKENRRHPAQQLELVQLAHHADVQQAIIGQRAWGYFHSAAVTMRIAHRNKERRSAYLLLRGLHAHLHWLERNQGLQRRQHVSATALQP